jgi:hypothetical protein
MVLKTRPNRPVQPETDVLSVRFFKNDIDKIMCKYPSFIFNKRSLHFIFSVAFFVHSFLTQKLYIIFGLEV